MRGRPHCVRRQILDVDPMPCVVLYAVRPPTEYVDTVGATMPATRVREEHAVASSAEQRHVRLGRIRRVDFMYLNVRSHRGRIAGHWRVRLCGTRDVAPRHALVE